jgi:hypothetical protein
MCLYHVDYRKKHIVFLSNNIYKEKGVILIKNAINREDQEDRSIPPVIPFKQLIMSEQDKQKIKNLFKKQKKEKTFSKSKNKISFFII